MQDNSNTIYFCHVCCFRSTDMNNFTSHMKFTKHNNKFSYNTIKKTSEIQKKKIFGIKRIIYIEETDACDEILHKLKNLQLKT